MEYKLIHISDIHFKTDAEESQDLVLQEFFSDLEKRIAGTNASIMITGDLVQEGRNSELFSLFFTCFDENLSKLNIGKQNRFIVPGNHDVCSDTVRESKTVHDALVNSNPNETMFNTLIEKKAESSFSLKFSNYLDFVSMFSNQKPDQNMISGYGAELSPEIGVYCLNSSFFSRAGMEKDYKKLPIGTRSLVRWCHSTNYSSRILMLHHPVEWLSEWAAIELKKIANNYFDVVLSGHNHTQGLSKYLDSSDSCCWVSAPPLLTDKHGNLGYSVVTFDDENGATSIEYRQWSNDKYKFVPGVNFTGNETGKINVAKVKKEKVVVNPVYEYLKSELEDALTLYPGVTLSYIEPLIRTVAETKHINGSTGDIDVSISTIVSGTRNIAFRAPPQFGLTSLGRYLCLVAWEKGKKYWAYISARNIKPHAYEKEIAKQLAMFNLAETDLAAIILDNWDAKSSVVVKATNRIAKKYNGIKLVLLQAMEDQSFLLNDGQEKQVGLEVDIWPLYLWTLTRSKIRNFVQEYNKIHLIHDDENAVVSRIDSDFVSLNLYRTPHNCITLLKASEKNFDVSPINRTDLIAKILELMFSTNELPHYKTRPDLKDSEFVIGRFSEYLIREKKYFFNKGEFDEITKKFCRDKFIKLETEVVFDVLLMNNVIVKYDGEYCFRFAFLIYYFASIRMHQDKVFYEYIVSNDLYLSSPDIMEFYTGRNRDNSETLKHLNERLTNTLHDLSHRCGFPEDLDPYRLAKWEASEEAIKGMNAEIEEGIRESNLPEEIKDQFIDRDYNRARPYSQSFSTISDELMPKLMANGRVCASALRNSDYADPEIKMESLQLLSETLELLAKVFLILVPDLTIRRQAVYEGQGFKLAGFSEKLTREELFFQIFQSIPGNVVGYLDNYFFNPKMAPLFFELFQNESKLLRKHHLALLLIRYVPDGWHEKIREYIKGIDRNSFYLMDIEGSLRHEYQYSYADQKTLRQLEELIRMVIAKHLFKIENPGKKAMGKVSPSDIPERLEDE